MNLNFIYNRYFLLMLATVIFQQLIVASSSYWLAHFVGELKSEKLSWVFLTCYLLSLLLPYIPGAISLHLQVRWNFSLLEQFYEKTLQTFKNKIGLWNDEETKNEREALLIKEGPQFWNDLTLYAYDLVSISLNAIFNIWVVIYFLDISFLLSYAIGLALTLIVLGGQLESHGSVAADVEKKKGGITQHLASAWDHWLLNNKAFLQTWCSEFSNRLRDYQNSLDGLSYRKQSRSVSLCLATFLPTLVAIFNFALKNQRDIESLLSLTVLMPRLFMILGNTTSLIYLAQDYSILKSRGDFLKGLHQKPWECNWQSRIRPELIKIEGLDDEATVQVNAKILNKNGYWTVRGLNGAGKSSWLMKMKEQWGEKACYLPSKSHLGAGSFSPQLSTGQKIKEQIKLALSQTDIQVLMLDEWDANLDEPSRLEILKQLRDLGEKMCVVDVRHR